MESSRKFRKRVLPLNQMIGNADKCQLITNKKGNFTITIKNEVVSNSGTAKILGVTFDSASSFEPQYQTNLPHWKFQIKCDCENEPIS